MNHNISCSVCQDLLPLVQDGVASPDSCRLVEVHLAQCADCCSLCHGTSQPVAVPDDRAIVSGIRKRLYGFLLLMVCVGTALGLAFSNSQHMFYNILIMPAVGALAYGLLKRRAYFAPLVLFGLSYIWLFIAQIVECLSAGRAFELSFFMLPLFFSVIYAFCCLLGVMTAHLFHIAFKKEIHHET